MEEQKKPGYMRQLCTAGSGVSSMRLMSFISLGVGSMIAIVGLIMRVNLSELSILSGVFVTSAFGGKALQKFAENKGGDPG